MRRGFTLTETIVTLLIASTLSGAAIYLTSQNSTPGGDVQTRAALWGAWQAQVSAESTGQAPAGAALLADVDPVGEYTDGASTRASQVSVATGGTVAYMSAVSRDGSCWSIRYDSRPGGPDGTHRTVWAILAPGLLAACDSSLEGLQERMDAIAGGEHPMGAPAPIDA